MYNVVVHSPFLNNLNKKKEKSINKKIEIETKKSELLEQSALNDTSGVTGTM